MPTTKQLAKRATNPLTGGSELAAVCGVDPYRSAYDVWLQKTGRIDQERIDASTRNNAAMEMGNMLEPVILAFAAKRLGKVRRNQYRVNEAAMLGVHCDALTVQGYPVEAKSSGMTWTLNEQWGETDEDDPSDAIPQRIIPQGYAAMIVTGAPVCFVPAMLGGRGFRMYAVEFRQDLADELIRRNLAFIHDHIETGIPPADSRPSMEFVRALRRQPNQLREIPEEIVASWLEAKRDRLEAEKAEEQCKRDVLLELEGCDGGTVGGVLAVTNKMQTRKAYSVAEATYPVLREVKQKDDHFAGAGNMVQQEQQQ